MGETIAQYAIVYEAFADNFAAEVNRMITEGDWQPYGSAFYTDGGFCQPMVRLK